MRVTQQTHLPRNWINIPEDTLPFSLIRSTETFFPSTGQPPISHLSTESSSKKISCQLWRNFSQVSLSCYIFFILCNLYFLEFVTDNEIETPSNSRIQLFLPGLSLFSQGLEVGEQGGSHGGGLSMDLTKYEKKAADLRSKAMTRAIMGAKAGTEEAEVKVEDPLNFWIAQVRLFVTGKWIFISICSSLGIF